MPSVLLVSVKLLQRQSPIRQLQQQSTSGHGFPRPSVMSTLLQILPTRGPGCPQAFDDLSSASAAVYGTSRILYAYDVVGQFSSSTFSPNVFGCLFSSPSSVWLTLGESRSYHEDNGHGTDEAQGPLLSPGGETDYRLSPTAFLFSHAQGGSVGEDGSEPMSPATVRQCSGFPQTFLLLQVRPLGGLVHQSTRLVSLTSSLEPTMFIYAIFYICITLDICWVYTYGQPNKQLRHIVISGLSCLLHMHSLGHLLVYIHLCDTCYIVGTVHLCNTCDIALVYVHLCNT